ncbi:hypothetical protein ACTWQB_14835 [Piscibacillus sp. B03]|uniref:hypothetical protein n=1 Tax=Piscibacillus sp. B03 TaxID=3457430 RepID=UPI003FCC782F
MQEQRAIKTSTPPDFKNSQKRKNLIHAAEIILSRKYGRPIKLKEVNRTSS